MMVHVTLDVLFRTALNNPLRGTNQAVAAYYMIGATFLPIAFLGRTDGHITADVFSDMMPAWMKIWTGRFALALSILWVAVFTWQSWVSALRRMAKNELLEIPNGFMTVWPSRFLLPVAGAALLAVLVLRLAQDLRGRSGERPA